MGRRGLKLAYLHTFVDRNGKARYYFRRNGKRTPLPGPFGSKEFREAYEALIGEPSAPPPTMKERAAAGTLSAIAERYFASPQYLRLAPSTRRHYRRVLEVFLAEHGHRRIDQMTRSHVDVIIGRMADRPGAANVLLKRLRTLVRYAIDLGITDVDPTARAKLYKSKEIHTWSEAEIETFEKKWPSGSRERLTFALLLYTGQRGSDVHRMTWADIAGNSIHVTQMKTRTKLVVPLHPALATELAKAKRRHLTILATAYDKPFSVKGFGQMISAAIQAAGLPTRCKAHGLRKAAARRLAEAGATASEIASITGHKTLAEVERYTRAADQERLALQAIGKQSANAPLANRPKKFANRPRNYLENKPK